jgi:hypothetical protein
MQISVKTGMGYQYGKSEDIFLSLSISVLLYVNKTLSVLKICSMHKDEYKTAYDCSI